MSLSYSLQSDPRTLLSRNPRTEELLDFFSQNPTACDAKEYANDLFVTGEKVRPVYLQKDLRGRSPNALVSVDERVGLS